MRSLAILAVAFGILSACEESETMLAPEPELATAEARHQRNAAAARTYDVTVENLATGAQYFTPPLIAIHRGATDFFTVGKPASFGIQQIAENGNLAPMIEGLGMSKHVSSYEVALSPEGPLAPGEAVTVSLSGRPGSNFISFASMLICTNDGFTGVDGAKLPKRVGEELRIYVGAYDAGTEMNTEDFADLVPPCQVLGGVSSDDEGAGASDPALAEGGVVHPHPGITGRSDLLSDVHGWADPIAMFTVRRTG